MNEILKQFYLEKEKRIAGYAHNKELRRSAREFMDISTEAQYSYNFSWLGRPIIQIPQDMAAMQEIIFQVKPDLIIETGIAHGGSLIFSASMLELNAACGWGAPEARVLGLDIDIRAHNRGAIKAHPMYKRITMMEGSSIDEKMIAAVKDFARPYKNILLCLDSNHTHDHVLAELNAYAPLVAPGSYCVVFDTVIEYMPEDAFPDRPWGRGNNPMTAMEAFLKDHPEFIIDEIMDAKLLLSVAPRGYLQRIK